MRNVQSLKLHLLLQPNHSKKFHNLVIFLLFWIDKDHYLLKSVLACQFSWIIVSRYKWWEKAKLVESNAFFLVKISMNRYDGENRAIYLKKNNWFILILKFAFNHTNIKKRILWKLSSFQKLTGGPNDLPNKSAKINKLKMFRRYETSYQRL